jgi:hypothetical protein
MPLPGRGVCVYLPRYNALPVKIQFSHGVREHEDVGGNAPSMPLRLTHELFYVIYTRKALFFYA